jgi:UDP-glucose 4-epimerase
MQNFPYKDNQVEFWHADVETDSISDAACKNMDYVFHLAAIASVQSSVENPLKTFKAGEEATLKLLQSAVKHKVKRFILSSSCAVYGDNPLQLEDSKTRPLSPYAASKAACEGYVFAFANSMGVDGVSLRYFNIFGPRQNPSSQYSGVVSIFLKRLREGIQPTIYGTGLNSRDFTYVENVVLANLLAMSHPTPLRGDVFNIGCGQSQNVNEVLAVLNNKLGTNIEPVYVPARDGEMKSACAIIKKAEQVLGYKPKVLFEEGIERLVKYDIDFPSRQS